MKAGLKILILQLTILLLCSCSGDWDKEAVEKSKQAGDVLIEALAKYRLDNQKYPLELSELCPEYLSEIKPPVAGNKKWMYKTYTNMAFVLYFRDADWYQPYHPEYSFSSLNPRWQLDNGDF